MLAVGDHRPHAAKRDHLPRHGRAGPEYCWYPWLGARLEARGYAVELPHYPGLNVDPIEAFLPTVLANHAFGEETVLVGHSGGAALLLAVLEHIDARGRPGDPRRRLLDAGRTASEEPVLQAAYDWEADLEGNVRDLYFVNSVNDPHGVQSPRRAGACSSASAARRSVLDEGDFSDIDDPCERFELLDRLIA